MSTAVVENLDFTTIDRFGNISNEDNINANNMKLGDKTNDCTLTTNENSNLKRGGRFQQVNHAYLGFGGHIRTDIPKIMPTQEDKTDFVVN